MKSLPSFASFGSFVFATSIIPVGENFARRHLSSWTKTSVVILLSTSARVAPRRACDRTYWMFLLDGFNGCGKIARK